MKNANQLIALLIAAALGAPQAAVAQVPTIGAAGAVKGKVIALKPVDDAKQRSMKAGSDVFHKDRVTTDVNSRMQVMLMDETIFTVGPESNVVLDEYVYDPFTNTGKITARLTKGVFRFVSGKIARKKPSNMKIKVPGATIGIRGTIGAAAVQGGGTLIALLGPGTSTNTSERHGSLTIRRGEQTTTLTQPGWGIIVRPGEPFGRPFKLSPQQLANLRVVPIAGSTPDEGNENNVGGQEPDDSNDTAGNKSGNNTGEAGGPNGGLTDTETAGVDNGDIAETVRNVTQDLGTQPQPTRLGDLTSQSATLSFQTGLYAFTQLTNNSGLSDIVGGSFNLASATLILSVGSNPDLSITVNNINAGNLSGGSFATGTLAITSDPAVATFSPTNTSGTASIVNIGGRVPGGMILEFTHTNGSATGFADVVVPLQQ